MSVWIRDAPWSPGHSAGRSDSSLWLPCNRGRKVGGCGQRRRRRRGEGAGPERSEGMGVPVGVSVGVAMGTVSAPRSPRLASPDVALAWPVSVRAPSR